MSLQSLHAILAEALAGAGLPAATISPSGTAVINVRGLEIGLEYLEAEDKAAGIITFLDYLWSPEGMELAQWGVEGESFKKENGENVYLLTYDDQEATPAGEKRWSFLSDRITFARPVDMEGFYKWNTPLIADAASKYFNEETLHPSIQLNYTVDEQQEMASLYNAIDPMVQQGCVAFVNGQRPMTEWEDFLAEIDALGYERVIEIQQAAYDRDYK